MRKRLRLARDLAMSTDDAATADGFESRLLDDLTALLALVTARDCGLLEQLARGAVAKDKLRLPAAQSGLLLAMLERAGVTEASGDALGFAPAFAALWADRAGALMARAEFTLLAAQDMIAGRAAFFGAPREFFAKARTFGFFAYGRAMDTKLGNLQDTRPWVEYVAALNAREAPVLAPHLPLGGIGSVLEIGGNVGGFALAALALHPALRAAVLDLPAVCEIGQRQVAGRPEAGRLEFIAGDVRADWPVVGGAAPGAILFKSVLHDWAEEAAVEMIAKAAAHVAPGGRVIIVERGRIEDAPRIGGLSLATDLVFASFYRPPEWYEARLAEAGLVSGARMQVDLDLPFHVISAERVA